MTHYPLSKSEYGIYAAQMSSQDTVYNISVTVPLPGDVDAERFRKAVREVIEAHPYLKTGFETDESGSVSKFIRDAEIPVKIIETEVFDCKELIRSFDLTGDILFRPYLILTPREKYFFLDVHHIICDGASIDLLLREISAAYRGEQPEAERFSANDYAEEERQQAGSPEYDAARAYYQNTFGGTDTDSSLYHDKNDRPHEAKELIRELSLSDSEALRELAEKNGVRLSTVFNAAFSFLLSKHTGSDTVLYSTVFSGRDERLKNAVGMFVKTIPVLAELRDEMSVSELLHSLDNEITENRKNSLYSYAEFCSDLNLHPSVLFSYQGDQFWEKDFLGLECAAKQEPAAEEFEFTVWRRNGRFEAHAVYPMDYYSDAVLEDMLESFEKILHDMLSAETLAGIDLLTESQRAAQGKLYPPETNYEKTDIVTLFRRQAANVPDRPAVVCQDTVLRYGELDRISENIAAFLSGKGIGREDVVSVLIPRCIYMAAAPLGVLKSGAAYQPLDPSYPPERLEFMIQDAGAKYLIADRELLDRVPGYTGPVLTLDEIQALPDAEASVPGPAPENLFIMLYTSGSTGVPKGVMLEHRNLTAFCSWYRDFYHLTPESRVAAYASFGFDADMMDLYPALTTGAAVHIIPEEMRLDMLAIRDYFQEKEITHSFMTTQVGRQYAELFPDAEYPKHLSVGGEKLVPVDPPKTYQLYNGYGPTECTIFANVYPVDKLYERIPIGKPLVNSRHYVVDKKLRLLPAGVPGELLISGHQVGRGYLNRPEQNTQAFIKNPFCDEPGFDRAYRTGDIVRMLPDGVVDFIGRNDGQVKIRGFRIELSEVESIIRKFEGIKDATVQAFDEQGGGKFIAAYVVSDEPVDIEALNDFIRKNKPPYMVPAVTMQIDRIPLNQNQKVNKRALPVPAKEAEDIEPPKNDVQKKIFDCIAEVIGTRNFGIHTDIFDAGLTSIGSIKLNVLLSKEFGVPVTIGDLSENSTVEALEALLSGREAPEEYEVLSDYPLSETQSGILVECILKPESTLYNIPYLFKLSEKVDPERLKKACEDTIDAHPYLKIKLFVDEEGETRVCRDDPKLPVVDIIETDKLPESLVTPFELFGGRLYKMQIFKTAEGNYLFLDLHHIICDGTSLAILIEDINAAYEGNPPEKEKYTGFEAVLDEKKARESEQYTKAKAYYDSIFSGVEHDFLPPKDVRGAQPASRDLTLYPDLDLGRVRAFCEKNHFTENAFFNAVFAILVSKFSFKNEALYVTVYNGRHDSRLDRSVTMLVKTLPVYMDLPGERKLKELVNSIGTQIMNSMSNDIYSFAEISRAYEIPADIMFIYQGETFIFDTIGGEPAEMRVMELEALAPIEFNFFVNGGKAQFEFNYRSDMYSEHFIRAFSEYFVKVTEEFMVKDSVKDVSLMTEATKERIRGFNATEGPVPDTTINRIFEAEVEKHPDRIAVIAQGLKLTYRELNEHANRIAHALMREGVRPDDMVGLMVPRMIYAYAGREGILKSGGGFLMLAPDYPDDRVEYIIENSGAKLLVTIRDLAEERKELFERCGLRVLVIEDLLTSDEITNPDPEITPHNLAYCLYTSGSTGKPKGVMIEHHSLVNYVTANPYNKCISEHLKDVSVTMAFAALTFDVSVHDHTSGLYHGKTVVIATEEEILNPNLLAKLIIDYKIEATFFSPSYANNLLDFPEAVDALRRMKSLLIGGEAFPAPLYRRMRELGITARLLNGYGPTETTIFITVDRVENENITIGGPVGNTKLAIFDKFNNELPPYVPGELILTGANVGRGYVKLDQMNKEKYISFEGLPAYRSGDLSRWNYEGKILFMGRMDNQVKLRGLRIELDEIENVMNTYPSVTRSLVLVKESEQEGQYLCAYFTADEKVDISLLKEHISKSLAKYMVPSVYMQLDSIPMNKNGKIDKKALPEPVTVSADHGIKAASTEMERKIVSIYAKALGRKENEFGVDDDFFENGGTSLTASKVVMMALSLELPIAYKDVFDYPTAEAMARHLDASSPAVSAAPSGPAGKPAVEVTYENALRYNTNEYVDEISAVRPLGRVLLTGSTGFLGSHVLRNLLERGIEMVVFCRSGDLDAEARLRAMTAYYFDSPFDEEISRLVKVYDADITSEGLEELLKDEQIDTIINCAAIVKHFAKDDIIERINVGGVKKLISLALSKHARLLHISTLSVAGEDVGNMFDLSFRLKENALDFGQDISNKYIHSKYMAEKAIIEAIGNDGLEAKIFRVGNLMGRQSDGEFQINSVTNSFIRSLKAYRVLGCFPVSACDQTVDFSPIDEVAESILRLSETDSRFTLFHCANVHEVQMGDVIEAMNRCGFRIDIVRDREFNERLNEMIQDESKNMLVSGLLTYSSGDNVEHREIRTDNTFSVRALYRLGYKWPITDEAYLVRVIESLDSLGFFDRDDM